MVIGDIYAQQLAGLQVSNDAKVSRVDLLIDLKNLTPSAGMLVILKGKTSVDDGLGGIYRWDSAASGVEDTIFLTSVPSNVSSSGRWVRNNIRAKYSTKGSNGSIPIVYNSFGKREIFITGTTDANSEVLFYLTDNGLASGNALFSEIWMRNATSDTPATGPADSVTMFFMSLSSDLKVMKFGAFKANAVTITLGLLLAPLAKAGSGIKVLLKVEGLGNG